jgi:hypothetical protein
MLRHPMRNEVPLRSLCQRGLGGFLSEKAFYYLGFAVFMMRYPSRSPL